MRIYIGDVMYEVDKKVLEAAKKVSVKCLESVKQLCMDSGGEEYLYITTLVVLKILSDQVLSKLTSEELEEMFRKVPGDE